MFNPLTLVRNELLAVARKMTQHKIPSHIAKRFRQVEWSGLEKVKASLIEHYFASSPDGYLRTEQGEQDLRNHLHHRLEMDRRDVIPWLDDGRPLQGAHVLEIGCGTGCSTVALAEQGARVTAVDIEERAMKVAKERCHVYGVEARFLFANATEVHNLLAGEPFDFLIFYASLEHMTHEERLTAMRNTWNMLAPGGLWCVVDSPNRLWYYDYHTALLNFFFWLPDELAFHYSRFSPRPNFRELYREYDEPQRMHFLRRGRGVSFHEFELAMKPVDQLDIVSSMPLFYRRRSIAAWLKWRSSLGYRYESVLAKIGPKIHRGFLQPDLYLIIRKD